MNRVWGWIAVVMLVVVTGGAVLLAAHSALAFDLCRVGDEISARDRESVGGVARAFVSRIREGDTTSTIESMSAAGRRDSTRAEIVQVIEMAAQNPAAALEMRRVFSLISLGSPRGWANCRESNGVSRLARGGGIRSAFVVLAEPFQSGERTWTFWVERERGEWRVRGVHLGLSAIGGIDGAEWRQMAVEQRRKNNVFNSTVLYDVANLTLYRGGFLQLSEADGLAHEREVYRRHQDLVNGRLQLAGEVFAIAAINAMSTDTEGVVLVIDQAQAEPVTIDEAIARNRALIDAMNAHRPEWREVFDGLSVGTPTGPNRVWRTLYQREGGYRLETARL